MNLIGGFNGCEAGMGIVYLGSLAILSLLEKNFISILPLVAIFSLLSFLRFNWYKAKILPGDSLTYLLGAILANTAIVGNLEKAASILLFPFVVEFFLKMRSEFKASCLGKLRKDGTLEAPYDKIYSLTHVVMKAGGFREKEVTLTLISFELLIAALSFLLVFSGVV